jgi:hypothetical protein
MQICGSTPQGRRPPERPPLITDFLCLLADPLGFEDPSLGIPVTAWTRYLSNILAVAARFLRCVRPALSPLTPPRSPEHACSTPPSAQTTTTMDSLDCSRASVSSVFLGSPSNPQDRCLDPSLPVAIPMCLA